MFSLVKIITFSLFNFQYKNFKKISNHSIFLSKIIKFDARVKKSLIKSIFINYKFYFENILRKILRLNNINNCRSNFEIERYNFLFLVIEKKVFNYVNNFFAICVKINFSRIRLYKQKTF